MNLIAKIIVTAALGEVTRTATKCAVKEGQTAIQRIKDKNEEKKARNQAEFHGTYYDRRWKKDDKDFNVKKVIYTNTTVEPIEKSILFKTGAINAEGSVI